MSSCSPLWALVAACAGRLQTCPRRQLFDPTIAIYGPRLDTCDSSRTPRGPTIINYMITIALPLTNCNPRKTNSAPLLLSIISKPMTNLVALATCKVNKRLRRVLSHKISKYFAAFSHDLLKMKTIASILSSVTVTTVHTFLQ